MTEPEWWLTEPQWLAGSTLTEMIELLADAGSERKLRLFAYACCQRIEHLLVDHRSRSALAALARYADGECDRTELGLCCDGARAAKATIEAPLVRDGCLYSTAESVAAGAVAWASLPDYESPLRMPFYRNSTVCVVANAALVAVGCEAYVRAESDSDNRTAQGLEAAALSPLLRDIFGNPFRPVAFSPSWRTDTAVTLACQMYELREFSTMPILADALQDAGCDNTAILDHCRDVNQLHVRGCWVVDLVLGKE